MSKQIPSVITRFVMLALLAAGCRSGPPCCGKALGTNCSKWAKESCETSWKKTSSVCGKTAKKVPGWDEMSCWTSAKLSAHKRYKAYRRMCDQPLSSDFKDGFLAGYADVADGGGGVVPPLPPKEYWKTSQLNPEGHARANDWFHGFEAGAAMADADGLKQFSTVPFAPNAPPVTPIISGPAVTQTEATWGQGPAQRPANILDAPPTW